MNSGTVLFRHLNDPRGPEEILPAMSSEELAALLDALFQNLDTPEPEFGAQTWYEMAVEETRLRAEARDWIAPASAGGTR